jgi:hypothetical protein
VSVDGTVGGSNAVALVTQAPGVARSIAGTVAGSVNELTERDSRSVDAALECPESR